MSGGARHHWNGKNHGIAKVIFHYLTQGKRVLVTAKGDCKGCVGIGRAAREAI
jgi:hypothetical protein